MKMFEHSVKVPRQYKIAANIFKKVSTEGGSVKTLLYDDKLRHFRTNALYALITETIKHATDIDKIFQSCSILENEPRLDPWLAKVLSTELLFGKKTLPGKSKPEQTILSYKDKFEQYTTNHQDALKTEVVRRPRYVRINTNLLTTSDAIRAFQDEGYRFVRCTSGSYNDYLIQIQNLTEYDFTQDYHVKTVFVFTPGTKLHEHELYLENKIILQDKATAMAVSLLAPPPGSVVLDMCAAPGMKSTQMAAFMRNEGKIYAVERNKNRYQTLCDFVNKTGSKCVETLHKDALEIKRGDYDDVEYILLDPSCSGSGMELQVHNYIDDTRLAKLTSLQEKFLKHAMNAFPKAKKIVYSTCSIFPEENERVITNVVKTSRTKWRVQDVKELLKGQWNNFGSGMYGTMGPRCLYAKPDSDLTTGFFIAVLDRDPKGLISRQNAKSKTNDDAEEEYLGTEEEKNEVHKKRKSKYKEAADDTIIIDNAASDGNAKSKTNDEASDKDVETDENHSKERKIKKDKRKKIRQELNGDTTAVEDTQNLTAESIEDVIEKKGKKKKKDIKSESEEVNTINKTAELLDVPNDVSNLNRKKKRKREVNDEVNVESNTDSHELENVDSADCIKKKKKKSIISNEVEVEKQVEYKLSKKKKEKHSISALD